MTLQSQVTRPTLKSDAERDVKDSEGVTKVVNELEVLPLSTSDDQLRAATEADKNLAGIQANTVPGDFSVKNNLRMEEKH